MHSPTVMDKGETSVCTSSKQREELVRCECLQKKKKRKDKHKEIVS